ncbi:TIGR03857 family LLM class F420-dependent oxidoreductase [Gordonia sp. NPDC003950]
MTPASTTITASPTSTAVPDTLTELGYYALSRHPVHPSELVDEARHAETIGLGTAFVSERFNVKDAAVLSGALAAATTRLGIATAATNHTTRHPIVTATMGATLAELSDHRFALGLGRGITAQWQILGLPVITGAGIEDMISILRRLWNGEMIIGHDGPEGTYPLLTLGISVTPPPAVMVVTMSPKTLELAGRIADGVVLHTFLDAETTRSAVARVRDSAQRAGRDPASVRIWSVLATVPDHLEETDCTRRLYGRLATYLQGYPDVLMAANRWSTDDLERIRATSAFSAARGPLDATATAAELDELAAAIPAGWVADCATGSADECARAVAAQFDLGVDSVILHGVAPTEVTEIVGSYRGLGVRPSAALPVNPGRVVPA